MSFLMSKENEKAQSWINFLKITSKTLKETATHSAKAELQTAISKIQSSAKFLWKLSQGTSRIPWKWVYKINEERQ